MGTQTIVIVGGDADWSCAIAHATQRRCGDVVIHAGTDQDGLTERLHIGDAAVVLLESSASVLLRAVADATAARPELGVLVLGSLELPTDVLVALASGATGYLSSDSSPATVADGVATLLAGDAVLPAAVSMPLLEHLRRGGRGIVIGGPGGHPVELTSREWMIFVLLRQARTTAEIAEHLVVSRGTVRTHVAALMHKLGVSDRQTLVSTPD